MRWAGATWRCQLRNVGAGGARTWVVPGPLGAFPRAPRSEGHSGLGSGETAEGTLLCLAKSLGFEGKRPCKGSTKLRVESGVRPGGLRSGPGDSEGGGGGKSDRWASLRAGCTFLRPHELLNCPFFFGFPDGCSGHRPPRPRSWGRGSAFGVLAGSQFYPVVVELPAPLTAPSTLSNPGCFGSLRVGGADRREHFLMTSCHRFCSTRAHGRSHFLRSRPPPTWPSVSVIETVLLTYGKCPPSEPSTWRSQYW